MNSGDAIANNPVVHTIGILTGCVDPTTNRLYVNSPCDHSRQQLNEGVPIWHVIYDRFFPKVNEKGEIY